MALPERIPNMVENVNIKDVAVHTTDKPTQQKDTEGRGIMYFSVKAILTLKSGVKVAFDTQYQMERQVDTDEWIFYQADWRVATSTLVDMIEQVYSLEYSYDMSFEDQEGACRSQEG